MTQPIVLYAGFDKGTDPVTGLTVAVNVYRITRASGAASQIVTAGSATALGDGVYLYAIAAADLQTYDYLAAFKTTGDVDKKTVWAVYPALANAYATELARLDAAVSTRLADADYSAAPSAADNADAVWDETLSGHATAGSAGAALTAAGSSADPLLNPVPGSYVQPQAGYYLGRLANNEIELTAVFDPTTLALSYYFGDDYAVEENRQQDFTTTLDLTGGATVDWLVRTATGVVVVACSIEDATTYRLAPTAAELATIGVGRWAYDLEITLANGHVVTEIKGLVTITQDVR